MSTEEHIHQLKRLRGITPDPAFLARSKNIILNSQKRAAFSFPSLRIPMWALAGLTAVAVFALGVSLSISFFSPKPVLSALDPGNLNNEFNNLNVNIELREIRYGQSIEQTITSAISEISDTGARHLNSSLIEQEKKAIEEKFSDSSDIDKLLEMLIE